jgi:uncharacterized protein
MIEPLSASAVVPTEAAARYVKQLVSHLGRKAAVQSEAEGERLLLGAGSCLLTATPDGVRLEASAESAEGLHQVKNVVGGHLERFGQRDGLTVAWREPSS